MCILALLIVAGAFVAWYYARFMVRVRHADTEGALRDVAIIIEGFRSQEGRPPTPDEYYDGSRRRPDGRLTPPGGRTLTSPVMYVGYPDSRTYYSFDTRLLHCDLFREPRGEWHLGYWSDDLHWILRSVGPDGVEDCSMEALGAIVQSATDSAGVRHRQEQLMQYQYDPSNGLRSRGDIIKTGP